jgi:predicted kinase
MRGTVVKRIRKQVYGDQSIRARAYNQVARKIVRDVIHWFQAKPHQIHERFTGYEGNLTSTGLRREYQATKVAYKRRTA